MERLLSKDETKYIGKIVELHLKAFPNFFLTELGYSFLFQLYKGYLEDEDSGIVVSVKDDVILGFLAYSNNYSSFFKQLLKKHLISFAFLALLAAIKHPSFALKLLRALNKSNEVERKERYVELSSICVNPDLFRSGIGSKLINYLKQIVDFEKYEYINLETDANANEAANLFYLRKGFTLYRVYTTKEGRVMNEYHFYFKKNLEGTNG